MHKKNPESTEEEQKWSYIIKEKIMLRKNKKKSRIYSAKLRKTQNKKHQAQIVKQIQPWQQLHLHPPLCRQWSWSKWRSDSLRGLHAEGWAGDRTSCKDSTQRAWSPPSLHGPLNSDVVRTGRRKNNRDWGRGETGGEQWDPVMVRGWHPVRGRGKEE